MKPQHRVSAAPRHELRKVRNQGIAFLALAFLFSIFVNLLMLTGPLFMLQVYDRVLGSRAVETLTALFLLVALLYALMAMLDYARGRIVARFGARFQSQLDERVFEATLRRSWCLRCDQLRRPHCEIWRPFVPCVLRPYCLQ